MRARRSAGNAIWSDCVIRRTRRFELGLRANAATPRSGTWLVTALRGARVLISGFCALLAGRRRVVQQTDQRMSRVRCRHAAGNDLLGGDFLAVERFVRVAVRIHRGAFQRHASEKTLGTRVGEHINLHGVGIVAGGLRSSRTSSSGRVAAEFGLAIQNLLYA